MSETKKSLPIDPEELATAGKGFFFGLLIVAFFVGLTAVLGLPLLVEHWDIPTQ